MHPLWIRGCCRPWIEHPVYAYETALATIRRLDPQGPLWRAWASSPRPTAEDFHRHDELPYETLIGDGHVKDYTRPLRRRTGLSERERVRLLYAYHQGHRLSNGAPGLEPLTRLALQLDELGAETVVYHSPVSVATGVDALGPEFEALTRSNRAVLEEAYGAGRSERAQILQTGDIFEPMEFDNPKLADEHLNERGRARLAELISAAVQAALLRRLAGAARGRRIDDDGGRLTGIRYSICSWRLRAEPGTLIRARHTF